MLNAECRMLKDRSAAPNSGVGIQVNRSITMRKHLCVISLGLAGTVIGAVFQAPVTVEAQVTQRAGRGAAAVPHSAPRTPWGDPDLQGSFTNSDESLIPMERPDALAGKTLDQVSTEELARLTEQRNQDRIEADKQRWELRSPLHWFENHNPKNSRAWLVVDPPDGKIPPTTAEAKQRASAQAAARRGRGEADSWEDRSLYDRCISRGIPGSMMPAIYGNSYQLVQGPGFVAIGYEMVNETRVIPLDGRPHVASSIRSYMGDARGHFEGETLVVETTNFNGRTPFRGSSEKLRLIERFKATAPNIVEWSVTLDDAATWTRPWTFAMNLTKVDEPPFEYACHEGNYAMRNILGIARQQEAEEAAKKAGGAAR
jgi:hypothetical protein